MQQRTSGKSDVLDRVVTGLVGTLIFLTPSNLFVKFFESSAYVNGLFIDYLIPKFYASDLVIWAIIVVAGLVSSRWLLLTAARPLVKIIGFLLLLLGLRQCFSPYPVASVWFFARLLEMGALVWALQTLKSHLLRPPLFWSILVAILFQTAVGLGQFLAQDSLFGFWFFGESNLQATAGILKISLTGVEKIVPYGTAPHPNVLAGSLVFLWWLSGHFATTKFQTSARWLALLPLAVCVFLTHSVSAWLMAVIVGALTIAPVAFKKYVLPLQLWSYLAAFFVMLWFLAVPLANLQNNWSWLRRATLQAAAVKQFQTQPGWGSGLNTSAALNEQTLSLGEVTRFAQPVHNVILLWLSETGLLGSILVVLCLRVTKLHQRTWLIIFLPVMLLDHYLLSLQTGLLLLVLLALTDTNEQWRG